MRCRPASHAKMYIMSKTPLKKNIDLLRDREFNKSTAFTRAEREEMGLRGLLPYAVTTQAKQITRIMGNLRRKEQDIEKYMFLTALHDRNERLFFQTIIENLVEIMPIIYTPTVGQACKEFSHIFTYSRGLYITPEDRGEIERVLCNWPHKDIRVIVVTDGQRILGLGDLGANGMGIPIGKLNLYTACAGLQPDQCLPIMLDAGTNNTSLLDDPMYIGYPHERLTGDEYLAYVDEFVAAVQKCFPKVVIQFEDFKTTTAYELLQRYRHDVCCFNDDIQGTAAVTLAGVLASGRITGIPFRELKIMFLGAGSAATGIGDLMVDMFELEGLTREEAYARLWFVDGKGLVVSSRDEMEEHKKPYAHDHKALSFEEAVREIKPHVLIGATGTPGIFTQEVIEMMSSFHDHPVIFALSNPTAHAECTPEEAYRYSKGRAVYASGSPFPKVELNGRVYHPGQANNAYIFPGTGLGVVMAEGKRIEDSSFLTAARTLAGLVSDEDIARGSVYPPLQDIRKVSLDIAEAVAHQLYVDGLAGNERPKDLRKAIEAYRYDPRY